MMAKKKAGPTWWKMFKHQRPVIESVSDSDAGLGLKAAFSYFDGEDIDPDSLNQGAFIVFTVIRPYIDESKKDYEDAVLYGSTGAKKRWNDKTTE